MRWLTLLLAVAACGGDDGIGIVMDVDADAPAYGRAPFPTDAIREGDHLGTIAGLDAVVRGKPELVASHVAALDGFGLRPVVEFFATGDLDAASIPATATVLGDPLALVDVDPASPEHGRVIATEWIYDAERRVVAGRPLRGQVLREGTRYAAVIRTAVTAGGSSLRALELGNVPARWQSTAEAFAELDDGTLAGIAVFTTQHASAGLLAARTAMASAPPPTLAFADPAVIFDTPAKLDALLGQATRDTTGPRAGLEQWGTDNPTGIAHDHVGLVATGTITIARFRGDDTLTDGPEDETFQLDASGTPRVLAIEPVPITFVLPSTAPPPDGFPVVIFGHGFGGSRTSILNLAEPLTARGYAVVGIDMWDMGSRYPGTADLSNNFAREQFTGDAAMPDGFGDDPGYAAYFDFFEGFLNLAAIRDAFRQSALDQARVADLVRQPGLDLSALAGPYGAPPTLDTRRLAYLGESFGTMVGTELAAIEPSIGLFVLDVPGGGLTDQLMPNSAQIGALAVPFIEQIYRTTGKLDRFHPALALMQAVFEGGDPLTFAPHVLRDRFAGIGPRHVICIEAFGDEIMPNAATTALAETYGLQLLAPDLEIPDGMTTIASPAVANVDGQTGVLVQYAPATHGYNWSALHGKLEFVPGFPHDGPDPFPKLDQPIEITEPIYETQEQVGEILDSYLAGNAPSVRSTLAPHN